MTSFPKTNADTACFARLPKAWPFLRAVDTAEADALRMGVVQDFDGVTGIFADETEIFMKYLGQGRVPSNFS